MLVPYVIKRNDTLSQVARRSGISLKQLLRDNPQIHDPDHILIGTVIKINVNPGITPSDLGMAPDLPVPPREPYVRTKDNGIIELPEVIKVPFGGHQRITQEDARRAGVSGMKGVGYMVSISLGESESEGTAAAKELGGAVAQEAAGKFAEDHGLAPEMPWPVGIILDLFTPETGAGEYQFLTHAQDGTLTKVMITYPTNQGIVDSARNQ